MSPIRRGGGLVSLLADHYWLDIQVNGWAHYSIVIVVKLFFGRVKCFFEITILTKIWMIETNWEGRPPPPKKKQTNQNVQYVS